MPPWGEGLACREVEAAAVDVRVAVDIDDQLVSRRRAGDGREIDLRDQPAVRLLTKKNAVSRRDNKQPAVGQPIGATGERPDVQHDFAATFEADRDHLTGSPVGEPETTIVPARLLPEHDAADQHTRRRVTSHEQSGRVSCGRIR
jgi:hypothetical protein